MQHINEIYINGRFVQPHGTEVMELINPSDRTVIGAVRLADEEDARQAIAPPRPPTKAGHAAANRSAPDTCKRCMTPSSAARRNWSRS